MSSVLIPEMLECRALLSAAPATIHTLQAAPAAPVSVSPGTTTSPGPVLSTTTPTFTWKAVSGVTGYQVLIYDKTLAKVSTHQVGASDTSYTAASGSLTRGDTFLWNVRGLNGTQTGPVSAYHYFQIPAPTPAAPVSVSPGTTTTPGPVLGTSTPTFTWQAVASVTGYQINVYDQTKKSGLSFTTGASATSYTPAAGVLTAGDTFVWNVRGLDVNVSGPPSAYRNFATPAALTAPVSTAPGSTEKPGPVLTTLTPSLTWQAVTGATGYQVIINDLTAKTSNTYTVGASVTSYAVPSGVLAPGDAFVWVVRAQNGSTSGPTSLYLYFQTQATALAAPVVDSPGSTTSPGPMLSTLTPTFTWESVTGATGYQINIYDQTVGKFASATVGASVTTYTPTSAPLAAGDTFVWNVRALNGTVSGLPSTYEYFQTPATVLAAPVSTSPGSTEKPGPVLGTLTPTLTWQAVTGATGYQIIIADLTANTSNTYTVGASVTSYAVPSGALAPSDAFVWVVRAQNGSTSGPASAYLYFQTATVLTAPVIDSPGSSTTPGPVLSTMTPTLTWEAVTGATGYQINLYDQTAGKFTSYTVGASDTSYSVAAGVLGAGDTFVWNVRALNGTVSGPPSTYYYFQTAAAPALTAPVVDSPGGTTFPGPVLTTATPTLTWESVTGATGYQINLYDQTLHQGQSYSVGASVTTYTVAAGVLTAGDAFVWNVRALNGSTSGPPSTYYYFQAPGAALTAPVAQSPGGATAPGPIITTTTPTFTWQAVTGATGYQINVYDQTLGNLTSFTAGASATSYTSSVSLASGDSFVWNVRALNATVTGPVSNYLYFQTQGTTLTAPVIDSPGSTTQPGPVLTTATPTLTWETVPAATGYQINVYDTTQGLFQSFTVAASQTTYTVAPGTLAGGDSFVWNVRALNGTVSGPPSTYYYFQTPPNTLTAPVIDGPGSTTTPGPVLTTLTPTLSWEPVTGATGYQINLYDETSAKFTSLTVGPTVTSVTLTAGTIAPGDTFVWNVRAKNGSQTGPESAYLYFQTPAGTLPAPIVQSPGSTEAPGPVLTTLTPTFNWQAVAGATGYQINVTDTTSNTSMSFTVGASATSYTIAAGVLTAGDTFVWNVQALSGTAAGQASVNLNFQTAAGALTAPVAQSPGSTTQPGPVLTTLTPTLSWQGVTGATGYEVSIYDITIHKSTTYTVGASATSYTIATGVLAAGDAFVWNVRALNGTQTGPVSAYMYFQT